MNILNHQHFKALYHKSLSTENHLRFCYFRLENSTQHLNIVQNDSHFLSDCKTGNILSTNKILQSFFCLSKVDLYHTDVMACRNETESESLRWNLALYLASNRSPRLVRLSATNSITLPDGNIIAMSSYSHVNSADSE